MNFFFLIVLVYSFNSNPNPKEMSNFLLEKLFKVVEMRGIDETSRILENALAPEIKFENPVVANIIQVICSKFQISIHELIHGVGRKNSRKMAIGFAALYLCKCEDTLMDIHQVKDILKKDESVCRKYMKMIAKLNPHHIADREYIQYKTEFDLIFMKNKSVHE